MSAAPPNGRTRHRLLLILVLFVGTALLLVGSCLGDRARDHAILSAIEKHDNAEKASVENQLIEQRAAAVTGQTLEVRADTLPLAVQQQLALDSLRSAVDSLTVMQGEGKPRAPIR